MSGPAGVEVRGPASAEELAVVLALLRGDAARPAAPTGLAAWRAQRVAALKVAALRRAEPALRRE